MLMTILLVLLNYFMSLLFENDFGDISATACSNEVQSGGNS